MIKIEEVTVYDVEECAELLKVNPQTIRRYIKSGKLKGQKVGGRLYVTADTIKALLKGGGDNGESN